MHFLVNTRRVGGRAHREPSSGGSRRLQGGRQQHARSKHMQAPQSFSPHSPNVQPREGEIQCARASCAERRALHTPKARAAVELLEGGEDIPLQS